MMLRFLDLVLSVLGLLLGFPLLALLYFAGLFDTGSPLFRQERAGLGKKPFTLLKFRTMRPETESVASHLADAAAITRWGKFLRRNKLDELPQLWNVLKGDMSLVGPRPCLLSQTELVRERETRNVFAVRPGVTGLAQVSGIDMSNPQLLAEMDLRMLMSLNAGTYLKYLFLTVAGRGKGDRIKGV
jgi:O-antigen biosynthesis protein WbqP